MRKLIVQEFVTIDGYFAGPAGEIDWHVPDEEYGEYAENFLRSVDALLFGRVTYELLAGYWPTATDSIADLMNAIPKFVFSKTLTEAGWQNTKLVKENIAQEINRLKLQPGKNLAVLGSAELVSHLLNEGLVDEFQLTVAPVILGGGKPLFKDIDHRVNMRLLHTRTLRSGCVQLSCQPE
ncbi:dihydrofolate reductase [Cohnella pontilimi]|uniref:Dihydrofolate reductase n=1 Tax=Cohnella pontilimi TaxID=2564100 RepID=A0A4U0F5C6_9BACL|nr:dihydrofolate reductase family protein [Cohnella pontilimi]TJY39600.1 dihydrofolate reductase [Cohnella pontilimi]